MIRPTVKSNRSWPVPLVSSAAYRRVCGKVLAGSAVSRSISSSRLVTHSSS
ncbi:hypothetical protein [Nocardia sp. NPDC051570]|uniref:hypothetical protein n=1 Tax=Nocardia sp. NPDC051570 TaxID=3364324 RepID=UPI003793BECF